MSEPDLNFCVPPIPSARNIPRRPSNISERMLNYLRLIVDSFSDVVRVSCEVTGTERKGSIRFISQDKKVNETMEFMGASRGIKLLRTPYDIGIPTVIRRNLVTWNPLSDILYGPKLKGIKDMVRKGILQNDRIE